MSNIYKAFEKGKAYIPYICCGDPDLETTGKIIRSLVENGADLIEIGIPFSDPTAENSVIQESSIRALSSGITTDKIFHFLKEIRNEIDIPLILRSYCNVIFSYGSDNFLSKCREIEIDGLILLDLPFEEKKEFQTLCNKCGLELISTITTSSKNRIGMIAREAEGFVYLVASGENDFDENEMKNILREIRENTDIACVIECDNHSVDEIRDVSKIFDGVLDNMGMIKLIEAGGDTVKSVGNYVKNIKALI